MEPARLLLYTCTVQLAMKSTAVVLLLTLAGTARAAEPPVDIAAVTQRGIDAFRAGQYAAALESLVRVVELEPRPALHFVIGRCHEELGQLEEARGAFLRFLASGVAGEELARGQRRLRDIEQRLALAHAEIVVRIRPSEAVVTIGGKTFEGPGPIRVTVRPGRYRLEARAEGYHPQERQLDLAGGATSELELTLEPAAAPVEPPPAEPDPTLSGQELAGWVLAGVGGASVVLAIGLTVASLDAHADAEPADANADGRADGSIDDARAANDRGNALGIGAITAYAVGGALVASGVALLLTADDSDVQGALLPVPGGAMLGFGARF